jgi:hypothetical protein
MGIGMKFGLIGGSDGNGHPYSWTAILNGYDEKFMSSCPYPVIPNYLSKKNTGDFLNSAKVTCIWTQDLKLSRHIAQSTFVDNILTHYGDMVGVVDGVIIARDDYKFAAQLAIYFLSQGIPVYLDKPGAVSIIDAKKLLAARRNKFHFFSCSALKYAKEFNFQKDFLINDNLKPLNISGVVPKSWDKYIIHVLSPLYPYLLKLGDPIASKRIVEPPSVKMEFIFKDGSTVSLHATGMDDVDVSIGISQAENTMIYQVVDPFESFKAGLQCFIDMVALRNNWFCDVEFLSTTKYIESGML